MIPLPPQEWDAVIAGGSLAGSTLGILLSEKGWRVLILEKNRFPRDKVCGEFLSPGVWPLLEALGLSNALLSLGGSRIEQVSVSFPSQSAGSRLSFPSKKFPFAYGISRNILDTFFLSEAKRRGCAVYEDCEVLQIRRQGRFFLIEVNHKAEHAFLRMQSRIAVNAAGNFNRWSAPVRNGKEKKKAGFKAHWNIKRKSPSIDLFFFKRGYLGLSDIENGMTNLCGWVEADAVKDSSGNFDELLDSARGEIPALDSVLKTASRLSPWVTGGPCSRGFRRFSDSIFAVGDAAFFAEPGLGQGMTLSLVGSFLLASLLSERPPVPQERADLLSRYEEKLKVMFHVRNGIGEIFLGLTNLLYKRPVLVPLFERFPFLWKPLLQKACSAPLEPALFS